MRSKVWCTIIVSLLFLFNQNFVILIIICIGKLTYRSFMSKMVILCWLLIWISFSTCATFEFLVAYVYGKFINWLSLLLRFLASFKDGACLLLYIWYNRFVVFMCLNQDVEFGCCWFYLCKNFVLIFSIITLHLRFDCWICCWKEYVGSLSKGIIWFSCMKV
jgi:hypothetical protein